MTTVAAPGGNGAVRCRPIKAGDGPGISELFRASFRGRYPLKDFMDPDLVEAMISDGTLANGFLAVTEDDSIAGTASRLVAAWNNSFELGRLAVHPRWQGAGVGGGLVAHVVEEGFACGLDICHGSVRNEASYRAGTHSGFIANGFLPGVMRIRHPETFLLVYRMGRAAREARVACKGSPLYEIPAIRRIARLLDLESRPGPYPDASVVRPPTEAREVLRFSCEVVPYSEHALLVRDLGDLRALPPRADHLQVDVLIHDLALMETLTRFGFQLTGFLPGWVLLDGRRYDCVRFVNCRSALRFDGRDDSPLLLPLVRGFRYREPVPAAWLEEAAPEERVAVGESS